MIKAKFYEQDGKVGMILKGHAGSAPKGEDLICASATMLAYTVGQVAKVMEDNGRLQCKPRIKIRSGRAEVIVTPVDEAYQEAVHAFWVVKCGIEVLAHNYPDRIKLM